MTKILLPYNPAETIRVTEAAKRAGKSARTIRNWCRDHGIGHRIKGQWAVRAPALEMILAGDDDSLQAYLAGDRVSDRIVSYFAARSIPLPSSASKAASSGFADFAVAGAEDT